MMGWILDVGEDQDHFTRNHNLQYVKTASSYYQKLITNIMPQSLPKNSIKPRLITKKTIDLAAELAPEQVADLNLTGVVHNILRLD